MYISDQVLFFEQTAKKSTIIKESANSAMIKKKKTSK